MVEEQEDKSREKDENIYSKKKIETLNDCVSEHGLQVNGMGVLMENSKRTVELLDKIQKFLFFMEKRQTNMEKQNESIIKLLSNAK